MACLYPCYRLIPCEDSCASYLPTCTPALCLDICPSDGWTAALLASRVNEYLSIGDVMDAQGLPCCYYVEQISCPTIPSPLTLISHAGFIKSDSTCFSCKEGKLCYSLSPCEDPLSVIQLQTGSQVQVTFVSNLSYGDVVYIPCRILPVNPPPGDSIDSIPPGGFQCGKCYTFLGINSFCQPADGECPCNDALIIDDLTTDLTAVLISTCESCAPSDTIYLATDCNNDAFQVLFTSDINLSAYIGKSLQMILPPDTEQRCWLISQGSGTPDTHLPNSTPFIVQQYCPIKLVDCATEGDLFSFSLSGDIVVQLSSYLNQVIRCTVPAYVTGSIDLVSCFKVLIDTCGASSVSLSTGGLGSITQFDTCEECAPCVALEACDGSPATVYKVSLGNPDWQELVDSITCEDGNTSVYIDLHDGQGLRCFLPQECTSEGTYISLDMYPVSFEAICCESTDPCGCCPDCTAYNLTTCDGSSTIQVSVNTTPDLEPYIGRVISAIVTYSGSTILGCFTVSKAVCGEVVEDATLAIDDDFEDCDSCTGTPCWRLTRCDDTGIYYIVKTDLSNIETKVVNGVSISNIKGILQDQCWTVSLEGPCSSTLELTTYSTVYPDCECCIKDPCA